MHATRLGARANAGVAFKSRAQFMGGATRRVHQYTELTEIDGLPMVRLNV
jgi:hypothetical protein